MSLSSEDGLQLCLGLNIPIRIQTSELGYCDMLQVCTRGLHRFSSHLVRKDCTVVSGSDFVQNCKGFFQRVVINREGSRVQGEFLRSLEAVLRSGSVTVWPGGIWTRIRIIFLGLYPDLRPDQNFLPKNLLKFCNIYLKSLRYCHTVANFLNKTLKSIKSLSAIKISDTYPEPDPE